MPRNPAWLRDELILALDFYLQYAGNPPPKGSPEIEELSETLNRLGRDLGIATPDRFRNVNGVYMKLMNFRRLDPSFTESGKTGLTHGGREEDAVWNEFASDPQRCHAVAEVIRQALADSQEQGTITAHVAEPETAEAEEGRVITAMHRARERNQALIKGKKQGVLEKLGRLACEACGFDFRDRYGERGDGFIECHHAKPVHTLKPGEKTKLSDLRLLCANCHRMVHVKRHWLTFEELVAILHSA
jgi:5-methylcytosine-specific restriction enzyme A